MKLSKIKLVNEELTQFKIMKSALIYQVKVCMEKHTELGDCSGER